MDYIKLTQDVLSVEEITGLITNPSCGAISLFVGTTRNNFQGKNVVRLEYEAYHEMAEKEMGKLIKEARNKWSLKHIALYHRLGLVPVTESSVIVAVSSEHRRESLDAVSFLIDNLKANVPIWKKEVYSDGSDDWKKNKECVWVKEEDGQDTVDKIINNNKRSLNDDNRDINEPPTKKVKEELDPDSQSEVPVNTVKSSEAAPEKNTSTQEEKPLTQTPRAKLDVDPNFVQIVASKQELDRRIAAFQQRKREELDVLNVQEFCVLSGGASSISSCARTSAIVLRSKGSNSHLKMTHVVNDWGPQTLGYDPGSLSTNNIPTNEGLKQEHRNSSSNGSSREGSVDPGCCSVKDTFNNSKHKRQAVDTQEPNTLPIGVEERLHSLEDHLKLIPGAPVPRDVYARLKAVEDRVLHLESISPEYFRNKEILLPMTSSRQKEIKAAEDDLSIEELDRKLYELKRKLKHRQISQVL
ncbi:molybdopterin synthase catalytic subunit-like isoform X2 [Homarus americanus]|uniref:molybdopterin synthase catalytic subunit-like isoform X2 n=1 Tax=Homarus americanus TaxID=6706 RepID=UPI001C46E233|nr:molybdopterin synthase catalytic subunit-like isoform X2 [Homarus americanus]